MHVAMNLPATATDFLDVFRGAFARELWPAERLPTVHVYAFSASEEPKEDIKQRVARMLGGGGGGEMTMQLHLVRDVAPKKLMVRMMEVEVVVMRVVTVRSGMCQCAVAGVGRVRSRPCGRGGGGGGGGRQQARAQRARQPCCS